MRDGIKIEDRYLDQVFSLLEKGLKGGMVMNSLKKGAELLQAETRSRLRAKLGAGATSTLWRKNPMEKGVEIRENPIYQEVGVHIWGDFRLKWFELGTAERWTRENNSKKWLAKTLGKRYRPNAFRGEIRPLRFFEEALGDGSRYMEVINSNLSREIEQLIK